MLIKHRWVCHYLICFAMMNIQLSVHILKNSIITRSVRNGKMKGSHTRTVGHHIRHHIESILFYLGNSLIHRCKIIKHILHPGGYGQSRSLTVPLGIGWFCQPQQIGNESFFIHTVSATDIISWSYHTAVFRFPTHRVLPYLSVALHTSRENPDITTGIFFPIHSTTGYYHIIIPLIDYTGTSIQMIYRYSKECNHEYHTIKNIHFSHNWFMLSC